MNLIWELQLNAEHMKSKDPDPLQSQKPQYNSPVSLLSSAPVNTTIHELCSTLVCTHWKKKQKKIYIQVDLLPINCNDIYSL